MAKVIAGYDPNASEGGFNPPPEGIYDLKITNVEEVKGKKANQLRLFCEIVGAADPSGQEVLGKKVVDHISMSPKASKAFTIPFLNACGVDHEEVQFDDGSLGLSFDTDDLIDCVFRAECTHDEYPPQSGKIRDKYGNYETSPMAGGPAVAPAQTQQQQSQQPAQQPGQGQAPPRRATGRRRVSS